MNANIIKLNQIVNQKYDYLVKSIAKHNKVNTQKAIDLLHEAYLKTYLILEKNKTKEINTNYLLMSAKNIYLNELKTHEDTVNIANIANKATISNMEYVLHQEKLDYIIYKEITSPAFNFIDEAILKCKILGNCTFKEISILINKDYSYVYRNYKKNIKTLKKIMISKHGDNINHYFFSLD